MRILPTTCPQSLCVLVLLLMAMAARVESQGFSLVKDINTGPKTNPPSNPSGFVVVGANVFFRARTAATGEELFRSAGTAATTTLVKDVFPGPGSGNLQELTAFGNGLVFSAQAPSRNGNALWRSDGTAAGTTLVTAAPIDPDRFTSFGSHVYFLATTVANGRELWRTDGTAAGTTVVRDVRPGAASGALDILGVFNGLLYFAANDGQSGSELWRTDGTAGGTQLAVDLFAGGGGSLPTQFAAVGGYFLLRTEQPTPTLWRSDGTPPGTTILKASSASQPFVQLGAKVYFRGADASGEELWETDGTRAGTRLLKDIAPGTAHGNPRNLTRVGNTIFFAADDAQAGNELWKTDGTAAGTTRVADIVSGPIASDPSELVSFNGALYFTAFDMRGREFWRSDGTAAGTTLVRDFHPDLVRNGVSELAAIGNRLWLSADDKVHGEEPWVSDGTPAGTMLVRDLNPARPGTGDAQVRDLVGFYGSALFFAVDAMHGDELWRTDGTAAGTRLVLDTEPGAGPSIPELLTVVGRQAFFVKRPNSISVPDSLWRTDGTAAGTTLLRRFASASTGIGQLTAVGDDVFFYADDVAAGRELWKSDGTVAGTVMVKDIRPGSASSSPNWLTAIGTTLFFEADDGVSGTELWKSDGTAAGTVLVKDVNPIGNASPSGFTAFGGMVYFAADDGVTGSELWRSDGTAAGTTLVKDIDPNGSGIPTSLVVSGGMLFFDAHGGSQQLWVSDGTTGGTRAVTTVSIGVGPMIPFQGGVLFLGATASSNGNEVWRSDGTVAGTFELKDLERGPNSSTPSQFFASGSRYAFFRARTQAAGVEFYVTDGTTNGTFMVDLHAGASSSSPSAFAVVGGRLLFSADRGPAGAELWSIDLPASTKRVGSGCGEGIRVPTLDLTDPILGRAATLTGRDAKPGTSVWIALSLGSPPPFKLGPQCSVYLDPATMALVTGFVTAGPQWTFPLNVPADPRLAGLAIAVQALNTPTAAPLGIDVTNAVHAWLGP